MKATLIIASLMVLAGCSSHGVVYNSPYDLNRDGVLDARCPGTTYDTSRHSMYGWRSKASKECEKQTESEV